jgi:hypothetical protein
MESKKGLEYGEAKVDFKKIYGKKCRRWNSKVDFKKI